MKRQKDKRERDEEKGWRVVALGLIQPSQKAPKEGRLVVLNFW